LREFHAKHFPGAPIPEHFFQETGPPAEEEYVDYEDDGLGYYEDGVKRTLTDEQIALFRHTEIQTILRERRLKREAGDSEEPESKTLATAETQHAVPAFGAALPASLPTEDSRGSEQSVDDIPTTPQTIATPKSPDKNDFDDRVKDGRVEKPKNQWKKMSHNQRQHKNAKSRKAHKKRKKEERRTRREGEGSVTSKQTEEDQESDEWDPWHQANGPDAQKAIPVDLDY
jgi:hypothetical protein